ncbi:hypothetical protein [Nonomuraea sp. NPDC005650]|uniref:hypothetical protein n=1 Tax=Nonomuraea sp. NPDC005650 TaxID=3157045 RepID=UPI00339E4103
MFDLAHALYQPYQNTAPWKTPYDREQATWARMTSTISAGAAIRVTAGTVAGAGIAGATVAAASPVGLLGPFAPAAVIGCLD